jgi:dihydroneopterin aldolase
MTDHIFLSNIVLHAYHGVYSEEKKLGQRFIFDLVCHLDVESYSHGDDVSRGVNYEDLYNSLKHSVCSHSYHLIEKLGEVIISDLLDQFPALQQIDLRITKPEAPLPLITGQVGVALSRKRRPQ